MIAATWSAAIAGASPAASVVGQSVDVRIVALQAGEEVGRLIGRHQRRLPAQQRRRKADGEAVAIRAEVDDVATSGKRCGEPRGVA